MSGIINRFFSKVIALIVIILFIVGFRESILTDSSVEAAFGGLMETLPFAKIITDAICQIGKYQYQIPPMTASGIGTDIMKLLVMTCIQPIAGIITSVLFLRLPSGLKWYEKEDMMDRAGYRIKETLIKIVTIPFVAFLASWITNLIFGYFSNNFNSIVSGLLQFLSVAVVGGISIAVLAAGTAIGTAIAWRLLVTVGGEMMSILVNDIICLWMYVALLNGANEQVVWLAIALFVCLAVIDVIVQCFQLAIVGGRN